MQHSMAVCTNTAISSTAVRLPALSVATGCIVLPANICVMRWQIAECRTENQQVSCVLGYFWTRSQDFVFAESLKPLARRANPNQGTAFPTIPENWRQAPCSSHSMSSRSRKHLARLWGVLTRKIPAIVPNALRATRPTRFTRHALRYTQYGLARKSDPSSSPDVRSPPGRPASRPCRCRSSHPRSC